MRGRVSRRVVADWLSSRSVGLVLSGGGAKGAYQVGVIKCLADYGVRITAVSGASVGALNGALLVASRSAAAAVPRLVELWRAVAGVPPREMDVSGSFLLRLLGISGVSEVRDEGRRTATGEEHSRPSAPSLIDFVRANVGERELGAGLPLYVSVFRSGGALVDFAWACAGLAGVSETPDSEFLHVQSLPPHERYEAIVASAALPLLFEARRVSAGTFADGGVGGMRRVQGNTPISPLASVHRCEVIIVTHLIDGSVFDRTQYPESIVLEVRPHRPIARLGGLADTLSFRWERFEEWMSQGYDDALVSVTDVARVLESRRASRHAEAKRRASIEALNETLTDPDA
jgi:NTE family protein